MSSFERKDKFYHKAKSEGYPARSAYKLIELNQRFKIFKPGRTIVDLGCAPGGWLKVAEEELKGQGLVIGIDLLPLQYKPADLVNFIQGDFLTTENQKLIADKIPRGADWILSDLSPNITGIKFKDLQASKELGDMSYAFAQRHLKKNGGFIIKIFPGEDSAELKRSLKQSFERLVEILPEATRKTSNEVYWVGTGYKK